ncbi:MAG: response regulator [Chloroflexi bacterium]|nr:response regulator [Chloroflexota bacterium]
MKPKVRVLWIDDDPSRTAEAMNLCSSHLVVDMLRPEQLESKLSGGLTIRPEPDIFLVDYYLNQYANVDEHKYAYYGLTIAAQIREHYPEYPIYLVTEHATENGEAKLDEWRQAAKASFDRILTLKIVQRSGQSVLYNDALYYRSIRELPRGDPKQLLTLLKPTDAESEDRLRLILPSELRNGLGRQGSAASGGNAVTFARWLREVLLAVPGFLYDDLHTSTHLGMALERFSELSDRFKQARYSGIFARTCEPLWWVSALDNILFSSRKARKAVGSRPWEVAPAVFGIPDQERSKCAVCGAFHPETVGVNLEDANDLRPVHFRCSQPHPNKKRELYFDEPRAFRLQAGLRNGCAGE